MTPRERAIDITDALEITDRNAYREAVITTIENVITAAVEEDRRTRPHPFVGRTDRYCELCNEPDRDEIHIASREMMRNRVILAVEEEREACAKVADEQAEFFKVESARVRLNLDAQMADIKAARASYGIANQIRERCNKSATESITK